MTSIKPYPIRFNFVDNEFKESEGRLRPEKETTKIKKNERRQ